MTIKKDLNNLQVGPPSPSPQPDLLQVDQRKRSLDSSLSVSLHPVQREETETESFQQIQGLCVCCVSVC